MVPKAALPLLVLLAAAGCRAPVPPGPAPDGLRMYAVADLLGRLGGVPKRGYCVLPVPETRRISVPGLVQFPEPPDPAVDGVPAAGTRTEDGGVLSPAERSVLIEVMARRRRGEQGPADRSLGIVGRERSPFIEAPDQALLEHIRSRLAATGPAPVACHLAMHDGGTLEARGSPAALSVVESALAELR